METILQSFSEVCKLLFLLFSFFLLHSISGCRAFYAILSMKLSLKHILNLGMLSLISKAISHTNSFDRKTNFLAKPRAKESNLIIFEIRRVFRDFTKNCISLGISYHRRGKKKLRHDVPTNMLSVFQWSFPTNFTSDLRLYALLHPGPCLLNQKCVIGCQRDKSVCTLDVVSYFFWNDFSSTFQFIANNGSVTTS